MKYIIPALLLLALAVPAAQAGVIQEINAADQVERQLDRAHRSVTWMASCRHTSRTRFTCSYDGYRGSKFWDGRAACSKSGRRYSCRILSYRRTI